MIAVIALAVLWWAMPALLFNLRIRRKYKKIPMIKKSP
jgi:uncharacterized membrane protein YwzB